MQGRQLDRLRSDRRIENIRQTGTIVAMDLKAVDTGYLASVGPRLQESFRASHILLRPLGNTIYVLPPYCVTSDDLGLAYDAIAAAVETVS
jgi:adenosylmethionine---8-amino-7-oxononanoate aminotransferase